MRATHERTDDPGPIRDEDLQSVVNARPPTIREQLAAKRQVSAHLAEAQVSLIGRCTR